VRVITDVDLSHGQRLEDKATVAEISDERRVLKFKLVCSPTRYLAIGNSLEFDFRLVAGGTTILDPRREIFALADVEDFELMAALRYSLDTYSGNSHTSTHR
jgi:hypothetical protein